MTKCISGAFFAMIAMLFVDGSAQADTLLSQSGQLCTGAVDGDSSWSFDNRGIISTYSSGTGAVWCPVALDEATAPIGAGITVNNVSLYIYTPSAGGTWTCSAQYRTPTGTLYSSSNNTSSPTGNTWTTLAFSTPIFSASNISYGGAFAITCDVPANGAYIMGYYTAVTT